MEQREGISRVGGSGSSGSTNSSLDRAFFRLHFQSSTIFSSILGIRARQGIEKILLLFALFSFLLFSWMHINHVLFIDISQSSLNGILYKQQQDQENNKITTVYHDVLYNGATIYHFGNSDSSLQRSLLSSFLLPKTLSSSSTTCLARLVQEWNRNTLEKSIIKTKTSFPINVSDHEEYNMRLLRIVIQQDTTLSSFSSNSSVSQDTISYIYSKERGLLTLPSRAREKLDIKLETITLLSSSSCLGEEFSRWALTFLGYESHVLNSLVLGLNGHGGYVLAEHSGEIHALSRASEVNRLSQNIAQGILLKAGTICSALFLVFSSSSLASFILAQTQQRMLRFTVALQQHVNTRRSVLPLVVTHLIDSVVFVPIILGVHFFLFEFFDDQLLAFYVILTVWTCEIWSITTCRTAESLKVFPRVFGLLMTWFHTYYLSYPFGYTFLCLITTVLGLVCCSFHLFNRYELPALQSGTISVAQPRSPSVSALLGLSVPSFHLLLRRQHAVDELNNQIPRNVTFDTSTRADITTTTTTTHTNTILDNGESITSSSPSNESSNELQTIPPIVARSIPSVQSSFSSKAITVKDENENSNLSSNTTLLSSFQHWTRRKSSIPLLDSRADDRNVLLYGTPGRGGRSNDTSLRRLNQSSLADSNSLVNEQQIRRKRAATESAFFDDWY
jgi:hypothetical protein